MDFYFYCSYENSVRGFFPTYLNGTKLVAADGSEGFTLPAEIYDFFSYDRFKILWKEYPCDANQKLFPEPGYSFFGMRGIDGVFSGKRGVINFSVVANENELDSMINFAVYVLYFYRDFIVSLPSLFSVGGEYGYDLNIAAFIPYMEALCVERDWNAFEGNHPYVKMIEKIRNRQNGIMTIKDLLRFAVITDSWKAISPVFGSGNLWKKCPDSVLTLEEFTRIFPQ